MRTLTTWLLALLTFAFSGCEKLTGSEEASSEEDQAIYFRWEQSLSFPPCGGCGTWCDMVSGNFKDDNPQVPDYAPENVYFGPCEPGTYRGQYNFDKTRPTESILTFSYTLEKPAPGYKRYYTQRMREYNPDLNRCVSTCFPAWLTYRDEKL